MKDRNKAKRKKMENSNNKKRRRLCDDGMLRVTCHQTINPMGGRKAKKNTGNWAKQRANHLDTFETGSRKVILGKGLTTNANKMNEKKENQKKRRGRKIPRVRDKFIINCEMTRIEILVHLLFVLFFFPYEIIEK